MTLGSLFSGIGGLDLGLERAGFTVKWQVEVDPYARRVLERHWPGVHRRSDVRLCDATTLAPVDCIAGGFPCQDISSAGKGVGITGKRSGLWSEYARLVRELRPRWVLVENVPALRTRGADTVLGDLEAAGYACEALVVGARHVGAPHRRDRVWIVGRRMGDAARAGCTDSVTVTVGDGAQQSLPRGAGLHDVGHADDERRDEQQSAVAAAAAHAAAERAGDVADAARGGRGERKAIACAPRGGGAGHVASGGALADASGDALRHVEQRLLGGRPRGVRDEGQAVARADGGRLADADVDGSQGERAAARGSGARGHELDGRGERGRWPSRPGEPQHEWEAPRTTEPRVGRAAHGVSRRLALKALGNAVVPQVAELLGRGMLAVA